MEASARNYIKLLVLVIFFIIMLYYLSAQTDHYGLKRTFKIIYDAPIFNIFTPLSTDNITNKSIIENTTKPNLNINTTTTRPGPTIDPAELVVERPPLPSRINSNVVKGTIAVFLFHTQHHVLADLQLYLFGKLTKNLVALELFIDGPISNEMRTTAEKHKAILHSHPNELHAPRAGPSDRNSAVVSWALTQRAKKYLGDGVSILILDGDVFPLTPFDAITLLNSHDLICRKHPALFARYCWIGFICISPHLYSTIHEFNVTQVHRGNRAYDSGGRTIEYLLKYPNTSFSWMKETIFLNTDKNLFWGAYDGDIQWISQSFSRCDKCGPEIFFSPFNSSGAVFYHMISATSEWRFGHQGPRRQALYDAIMKSPYGPGQQYSVTDMEASIKKVQKMDTIPLSGSLSCAKVCQG